MSTTATDYQQLIESIRVILVSPTSATSVSLETTASEYQSACALANARLRKCGDLLRRGLRSEAIQQSEVDPNLLDLVAVLDFPELTEWVALVEANGLAPPSALLVEMAGDLNESYAQEQPLAAVLRKNRLLALARAPLRDRLRTLRKLMRVDAGNPVWDEDVRTFERARMQELRRDAEQAYKADDIAVLEQLAEDVRNPDWLEPVPTRLVDQITQAYGLIMRRHAQAELKDLEPALNTAYSELDVEAGRTARSRWVACLAIVGLDEEDPLCQRAAPALEWLAEEDRCDGENTEYELAVAALEQGLDDDASQATLERLTHAVLRTERGLPSVLDQRLRAKLAELELARSRRQRLLVAGLSAIVVLVAGGVGLLLVRHQRNAQVAAHVATMQGMIEAQLWQEAANHLEKLADEAPGVASTIELQSLSVEVAKLLQKEAARKLEFDKALAKVNQAGTEQPDRAALEQATALARTNTEKAAVDDWTSKLAAVDRQRQKERDAKYLSRLQDLSSKVEEIATNSAEDPKLAEQSLAHLANDLDALQQQNGTISQEIVAQANPVRERIKAVRAGLQKDLAMAEALTKVIDTVGNSFAFAQRLDLYAKEYSGTASAVAFEQVVAERPLWDEVAAWNEVLTVWSANGLAKCDAEHAKELIGQWERLLADHPGHPAAKNLEGKVLFAKAIASRIDEDGTKLDNTLRTIFVSDPSLSLTSLWIIVARLRSGDEQIYYTEEATSIARAKLKFSYIKQPGDSGKNVKEDLAGIIEILEAPQSTLAKEILARLTKLTDESWEESFHDVVQLLATSKRDKRFTRLDPILQVSVLRMVLDAACQGSYALELGYGKHREALADDQIDVSVKWMDPEDKEANNMRIFARQVLQSLPPWEDAWSTARQELARFRASPELPSSWIGWLYRDGQRWTCALKKGAAQSGGLYVICPLGADKAFSWQRIGTLSRGDLKLASPNSQAFVEGRPVFLRAEPQKTTKPRER